MWMGANEGGVQWVIKSPLHNENSVLERHECMKYTRSYGEGLVQIFESGL